MAIFHPRDLKTNITNIKITLSYKTRPERLNDPDFVRLNKYNSYKTVNINKGNYSTIV